MSNDSKLLAGLILGTIAGIATGLLIAPSSGKETRELIKEKAKGFKDEIDKKLDKLNKESLTELKEKFNHVKEEASEEYKKVADKVRILEKEIETKIARLKKQADNLNSDTT